MPSPIVFKVKYGDTLRRFTVAVNGDQQFNLTMDGLRAKICSLFNLPADADCTLTYVDEDEDVVTLGNDEDLIDVVRQYLNPVRITVKMNAGTSVPLSTLSSGTSTRSPQVPNLQPNINAGVAEVFKAVPEPFLEALSKLSVELASKATASPVLADLIESFSKAGQSFLNGGSSLSGTSAVSAPMETKENGNKSFPAEQGKELNAKQAAEVSADGCPSSRPMERLHKPLGVRAKMPSIGDKACGAVSSPFFTLASPSPGEPFICTHRKNENKDFYDDTRATERPLPSGTSMNCPNDIFFPGFPAPPVSSQRPIGTSPIFHRGVRCDGCGVLPITGPRYKSKVKYNYDLCSICFAQMGNDAEYIRIDFPAPCGGSKLARSSNKHFFPVPPLRPCTMKELRPRLDSRFVMDVNVMDGTVMAPQTPFTKIWRMRNNGTLPWPYGTRLLWIGGDKFSVVDSVQVEIPSNGVHEESELDVAVDFVAPKLPGRYISYWKMQSPLGQKFGQRIWVLILVDDSLKNAIDSATEDLNLNFPPPCSAPIDLQSLDLNSEASMVVHRGPDACSNTNEAGTKKPVFEEQLPGDLDDTGASDLLDVSATASEGSLLGDDYPLHHPLLEPTIGNNSSNAGPVLTSFSSAPLLGFSSSASPLSNSLPSVVAPGPTVDAVASDADNSSNAAVSASFSSAPWASHEIHVKSTSDSLSSSTPSSSVVLSLPVPRPAIANVTNDVVDAPTPVTAEVSPTVSYPSINLSLGTSSRATEVQQQDPLEVRGRSEVEQALEELKQMGFNEVELNKEILKKNGYNLESSIDELCGISEWDPLLEELQEMGFYDKETNRRLLVKNNGSLKHVVMDLIARETSFR